MSQPSPSASDRVTVRGGDNAVSGYSGGCGEIGDPDPTLFAMGGEVSSNGTYIDVISSGATAAVEPDTSGDWMIRKVTWEVDGGFKYQVYSEETGFRNEPLTNDDLVADFSANPTFDPVYLSFFWTNEPQERIRQIKATVENVRRLTGEVRTRVRTIDVKVQPPEVDWFRNVTQPMGFQLVERGGVEEIGFTQATPRADGSVLGGNIFNAQVDTPADPRNEGSTFAVLQIVTDSKRQITYNTGARLVIPEFSDTAKLDRPPDRQSDFVFDWISHPFAAGLSNILLPQHDPIDPMDLSQGYQRADLIEDSPSVLSPTAPYIQADGEYAVKIEMSDSFVTHLMYKAKGGDETSAYVSISHIEWSVAGTATLRPEPGPLRTIAYYRDRNNWDLAGLSPQAVDTLVGTNAFVVPDWNGRVPNPRKIGP